MALLKCALSLLILVVVSDCSWAEEKVRTSVTAQLSAASVVSLHFILCLFDIRSSHSWLWAENRFPRVSDSSPVVVPCVFIISSFVRSCFMAIVSCSQFVHFSSVTLKLHELCFVFLMTFVLLVCALLFSSLLMIIYEKRITNSTLGKYIIMFFM